MSFAGDFSNFTARFGGFFRAWRTQASPPASCDAQFISLAQELFSLQFKHSACYRKLCEARGVIPQKTRYWADIPAMPTSAFKELELSCLPVPERTRVFHSSGTTENRPSRHFHSAESIAIYEESLWTWFREKQKTEMVNPDAPKPGLLILTPPPAHAPHSSLVHMFETIRRRLEAEPAAYAGQVEDAGAWTLDLEAAFRFLQGAQAGKRPVLLLGTAFSYVHLIDALDERSLQLELPPGSQAMETGGYKGRSREMPKPKLHELISRRLGIPRNHIFCEYGMSELSSQAYEWETGDGRSKKEKSFQFPPWARAQIISPETGQEVAEGEIGLIRVFDLANVFSVLAVQTEDLGVRRRKGFELAGRAVLAEARGCSLMPA